MTKTALITGASAGIGKAFAVLLAAQKYNLYIVARRLPRLEQLAKELTQKYQIEVTPVQCDLSKAEERTKLYEATKSKGHIDLLINNAGFGFMRSFEEQGCEQALNMIQLNISAVVELSSHYLPAMVERKTGAMIIVSSTTAFQSIPYVSVYAATKGFDLQFSEALYYELKPKGVHVLTLCPGLTSTEFGDVAGISAGLMKWGMSPEAVAMAAIKGLRRKKRLVIAGFSNRCLIATIKILPRSMVNFVTDKIVKYLVQKS